MSNSGRYRGPSEPSPANDVDQAIDIGRGIEHAERNANAVSFGRDAHAVFLEMAEPVGREQTDDVDVRGAVVSVARADQADAKFVQASDQVVAKIEAVVLDVLHPDLFDHVEGCAE